MKTEYHAALAAMAEVSIPRDRFWSVIQAALAIRMPKDMPEDRLRAWEALEWQVDQKIADYSKKFGDTAYALMNTITESRLDRWANVRSLSGPRRTHSQEHEQPPNNGGVPTAFVQRERHSLQRLAGMWVAEFGRSLEHDGFDLASILRSLPAAPCVRRAGGIASRRSVGLRAWFRLKVELVLALPESSSHAQATHHGCTPRED